MKARYYSKWKRREAERAGASTANWWAEAHQFAVADLQLVWGGLQPTGFIKPRGPARRNLGGPKPTRSTTDRDNLTTRVNDMMSFHPLEDI